ncbi:ribosome maturation factor RimM [Salinibacterium sp. UTAS2018]|uniref:ribosome maturation factor RimM n=1 Tax=Salinibacterium sp. UTAS2018 TaxID=2508880 RepID=UPI001FF06709|nr:ribosome maturation factor RimM [Salinibacterium sp. UTAS2018]
MSETKIPREGRTQLRVGRLTKAHGLKGAIKVEMYTDAPERRFVPGAVFSLQVPTSSPWHGKTLELIELKWFNAQPVAFFKGIPDRSAAEKLVKAILWIDHDPNEAPEDDAWFNHQLIGLKVIRDGKQVGTLAQVDHFPAQDLLTVTTENGDVLVPFVKSIVASVDIDAGEMVVTPPPGLFEEIADDASVDETPAAGSAPSEPADADVTDSTESD